MIEVNTQIRRKPITPTHKKGIHKQFYLRLDVTFSASTTINFWHWHKHKLSLISVSQEFVNVAFVKIRKRKKWNKIFLVIAKWLIKSPWTNRFSSLVVVGSWFKQTTHAASSRDYSQAVKPGTRCFFVYSSTLHLLCKISKMYTQVKNPREHKL